MALNPTSINTQLKPKIRPDSPQNAYTTTPQIATPNLPFFNPLPLAFPAAPGPGTLEEPPKLELDAGARNPDPTLDAVLSLATCADPNPAEG